MTDEEIPRTDLCEECGREITAELVDISGKDELIHTARKSVLNDDAWKLIAGGSVTIVFRCRCSSFKVDCEPVGRFARDVPESWLWESEFGDLVEGQGL